MTLNEIKEILRSRKSSKELNALSVGELKSEFAVIEQIGFELVALLVDNPFFKKPIHTFLKFKRYKNKIKNLIEEKIESEADTKIEKIENKGKEGK